MTVSMEWVAAWLIAAGLLAMVLTVADKRRSKKGAWRVPERTLWLVAVLGGGAAMYLVMRLVRHKTRHRRFMWGLPALLVAQAGLVLWLMHRGVLNFV